MQVTSFVGKIDYQQSQRVFRQRPSRERKKQSGETAELMLVRRAELWDWGALNAEFLLFVLYQVAHIVKQRIMSVRSEENQRQDSPKLLFYSIASFS